jgi:hypothetical protein
VRRLEGTAFDADLVDRAYLWLKAGRIKRVRRALRLLLLLTASLLRREGQHLGGHTREA